VSIAKAICQACGQRATLVKIRPARYEDNIPRCRPCGREHVERIVTYWREVATTYAPSPQNRGGLGSYGAVMGDG
jgi:NAD-dependent SIR2 family protein deacetylase